MLIEGTSVRRPGEIRDQVFELFLSRPEGLLDIFSLGDVVDSPDELNGLSVLVTVISAARTGQAVLDVGHKGLAGDSGPPVVVGFEDAEVRPAGDEHTRVLAAQSGRVPERGQKVRLIPGHCDPTVNLYDWYVGVRAGVVEALWPVTGRGPGN